MINKKKLLLSASSKMISGFVILCLLIFLPAGTVHYPTAWLFMSLLFVPMVFLCTIIYVSDPELLAKRLENKEKQLSQYVIIALCGLMFVPSFVLAGLDHRYAWSVVPESVCIGAAVGLLLAYGMFAEVLRSNHYLSRIIEVQEGQEVIDTDLYAVIRHPMYTATILMFLCMPLILGSWVGFAVMLSYIPIIMLRVKKEEELLVKELEGYTEYQQRVPYRLIPHIW